MTERAAELLRREEIDPAALGWNCAARMPELQVLTPGDLGEVPLARPSPLLVVAHAGKVPPIDPGFADELVELALLPTSPAALKARAEWLAAKARRSAAAEALPEASLARLATAGRVSAGIAHELRNALSYARMNLEFVASALAREPMNDGDIPGAIADTQEGLELALETSRTVLDLVRAPEGVPAPLDVNAVVERTVRLIGSELRRTVRLEIDCARCPPALGLEAGLVQVLTNLSLNAADAAGEGGRVRLETRSSEAGVFVSVSDSGPGVSPEVAKRLFGLLASGKPGRGTGVGLALSRQLVEAMGGRLRVDRGELGGAEFTVELRRSDSECGLAGEHGG